ncbi:MAG: diguanylate cyclase [Elusimicrobia bacterium]|nr:diguanylate cyclase [Elusimicrobiota bacterium]
MPLWSLRTSLLCLALLPAAPAGASQASRVEAGPAGGSAAVGPVGNLGSAGPGTLSGAVGAVPLLTPALSPAALAPQVKAPLGTAAPGVSALPLAAAAPVPALPPSLLPAPAQDPGQPPQAEGPSIAGEGRDPQGSPGQGSDRGSEDSRSAAALRFDGSAAAPEAVLPELPAAPSRRAADHVGVLLRRLVDDAIKDGRVSGRLGQEIKYAAYIDPLTGALNRLYLDEEGDRVIAGRKTLITFKLDWLKEINDAAGHAAGDQFLAETARIVHRVLGPDGLLVRRSPTGFAVFTDLSGRQAELLAESLRAAVAFRLAGRSSLAYDVKTKAPLDSTIQLGVAPIAGGYESTLAAAERSRQAAKDAGGDLVADAQGRILPKPGIALLRRELRAGGRTALAGRLESELSRVPRDASAAPRRRGRRLNDILRDVPDAPLRDAVSDFLFRNRLSGLHNRRWLDENVADLVTGGRVTRYAALDLDKFGDINRALGEVKADKVLARFGRILAEFAAGHDIEIVTGRDLEAITARDLEALHLSGEEFCLLIGPKETDVRGLLEKLRQRVADELGPRALSQDGVAGPGGKPLRVTVSIGEARLSQANLNPLELVLEAGERAERSLVKAKGGGRNRVVLEGD